MTKAKLGSILLVSGYILLFIIAALIAWYEYVTHSIDGVGVILVGIAMALFLCFIVWCVWAIKTHGSMPFGKSRVD